MSFGFCGTPQDHVSSTNHYHGVLASFHDCLGGSCLVGGRCRRCRTALHLALAAVAAPARGPKMPRGRNRVTQRSVRKGVLRFETVRVLVDDVSRESG